MKTEKGGIKENNFHHSNTPFKVKNKGAGTREDIQPNETLTSYISSSHQ